MKKEKTQPDKKNKKRTALKVFLIILVIIAIIAGVFAYKVHKNGGGLSGLIATTMGTDEEAVSNLDTMYCVLLGQSQNLTDTIMLVAYNPKTQKASMLSIPRDTFVGDNKNKATAYDKINALCQYEHPDKTVAAIRKITGINVTKYVLIDTKALVKVVDLIGGVSFDVPIDMNYTDPTQDLRINLKAGYQLLNGTNAEGLVRFRHNSDGSTYPAEYGSEDLGRTRTQREFLMAVAKQTLKAQNILKLGGFLDVFYEYVKTNLQLSEIKDYLPSMVKFNVDELKTGILPGTPELCNGVWIYTHDKTGAKEIVNELFGNIEKTPEEIAAGNTLSNNITTNTTSSNTVSNNKTTNNTSTETANVEVLNGTGDADILTDVVKLLKESGYNVVSSTATTETTKTSIINRNSKDAASSNIKNILEVGTITKSTKTGKADITIIIGKDYK